MKKLLLLLLGLLSWMQCLSQTDFNLSPEEEKMAWEFIVETYFNNGPKEFQDSEIFYDDIQYFIKNGAESDSIFLKKLIPQIKQIVPKEVSYSKNEESANFIINLEETKPNDAIKFNHKPKIANRNGKYNNEIKLQHFDIAIPNKNKQNSIRNIAIIGLITGAKYTQISLGYNKEYIDFNSVILNFYWHSDFENTNYTKTKQFDNYIIKQLYSKSLQKRAEGYVWKEYNLWQYINWKFGSSFAKTIKIQIYIFYFLFAFFIGYLFIFNKKIQKS